MIRHFDPHKMRFNEVGMEYVLGHSTIRQEYKRSSGVVNRKFDNKNTDLDVEVIGVMGEIAVGVLLRERLVRWFNDEITLCGDGGVVDLEGLDRSKIQVKARARAHADPFIIFNSMDDFKADYAVLAVRVDAATIDVAGWIDRGTFRVMYTRRDFGHGMRLTMKASELFLIEALLAALGG